MLKEKKEYEKIAQDFISFYNKHGLNKTRLIIDDILDAVIKEEYKKMRGETKMPTKKTEIKKKVVKKKQVKIHGDPMVKIK